MANRKLLLLATTPVADLFGQPYHLWMLLSLCCCCCCCSLARPHISFGLDSRSLGLELLCVLHINACRYWPPTLSLSNLVVLPAGGLRRACHRLILVTRHMD